MRDEDYVCEDCLPKAVELRFKYFPYHMGVKAFRIESPNTEQCNICHKKPSRYIVSIIVSSLRKDLAERESRDQK